MTLVVVCPAAAQLALDARIPARPDGIPVTYSEPIQPIIGMLAQLTGVPIGVELVHPSPLVPGVQVSGLTLREALDAIARAGGYEWETSDGVVVLRTRRTANVPFNPLDLRVEPAQLENIIAQQALAVTCAHLGSDFEPVMADRHRFSVAFQGGSVLEWLNAVVRAHGAMAWAVTWFADNSTLPLGVTFLSGSYPVMCPVPGVPPPTAVDAAAVAAGRAVPDVSPIDFLDIPVGKNGMGSDVIVHGIYSSSIQDLARGIQGSIGFESIPGASPRLAEGFNATGVTLRHVLDGLVTVDPRYEWRLIDGVVVFRPVTSWSDPANPLFRPVDALRFSNDVPFASAVRQALETMGATPLDFPDGRLVTIDFPPGTVLDLLCALVRVQGNMVWTLERTTAEDEQKTGSGYRLMLLSTAAGGFGTSLP